MAFHRHLANAFRLAAKAIIGPIRFVLDCLYRLLFRYSEVVLLVIIVLVSVQVVLRKLFNSGIIWSEEVSLLLVVWMAFIAMAIGVAEDLHISISLFYDRFPRFLRRFFAVFNLILIAGAGGLLVWYGYQLILFTRNSTLPTTKWPTFILYLMIPVSGVYIIYFSIIKLYRYVATGGRKEGEAET